MKSDESCIGPPFILSGNGWRHQNVRDVTYDFSNRFNGINSLETQLERAGDHSATAVRKLATNLESENVLWNIN